MDEGAKNCKITDKSAGFTNRNSWKNAQESNNANQLNSFSPLVNLHQKLWAKQLGNTGMISGIIVEMHRSLKTECLSSKQNLVTYLATLREKGSSYRNHWFQLFFIICTITTTIIQSKPKRNPSLLDSFMLSALTISSWR